MKLEGSFRKPKVDLQAQCFTLSIAKTHLRCLVEKASKGETVYILHGQRRYILQEVPLAEPIPIRPAGYFADAYSRIEIQVENQLPKASVLRVPRDLE